MTYHLVIQSKHTGSRFLRVLDPAMVRGSRWGNPASEHNNPATFETVEDAFTHFRLIMDPKSRDAYVAAAVTTEDLLVMRMEIALCG